LADISISPPVGEAPLAPTALCAVTITADGIGYVRDLLAPFTPLGWAELEVLAAFAAEEPAAPTAVIDAVAERTGAAKREVRQFIAKSRYAKRLATDERTPWRAVPDHDDLAAPAPSLADDQLLVLRLPITLRLADGTFEAIDHEGRRIAALRPIEVAVTALAIEPTTVPAVVAGAAAAGLGEIDEAGIRDLLGRLARAGLLRPARTASAGDEAPLGPSRQELVEQAFARHAEAQRQAEAEREAATGVRRTMVVPVTFDVGAPLALGLIVASAREHDGGRLQDDYWFRTDWVWRDQLLDELTDEPAVFLMSNYLWSHQRCLEVSRQVKERNPRHLTVHGGPDAPKYEGDAEAHLRDHPYVDVLVRGEGEATAVEVLDALVPVVRGTATLAEALADVPGVTFRDGDRIVRTEDRERIAVVDEIPSPYLLGLFDPFLGIPDLFVTIETNRGCPYGCTFCDWGSATTSRVRKFDLDRVYAELEWCGAAGVSSVGVADANFGMFERDIEIAEKVADVRRRTAAPHTFGVSYAKNTVRHLEHIIRTLAGAGIMAQGVLSLQTMDAGTLEVIHRSNIKTERYDGIAAQMRQAGLPLMIELMMGLPGQSVASFTDDLQQCIDREVPARINQTTVLVNSPMNDPAYRAEHEIETAYPVGPGVHAQITSTKTFTAEDHGHMESLRRSMIVYENFGMLRLASRYVRHETGRLEMDLYELVRTRTFAEPERWPALALLARFAYSTMAPPYSWSLVVADLRRFLVDEVGVADDAALDAVLRAQHALLPAQGREFPVAIEVDHDVTAWHAAMVAAKHDGHLHDWPDHVAPLRSHGPGVVTVDDPDRISEISVGLNGIHGSLGINWELDSPLSRARISSSQLVDFDQILPRHQVDA